MNFAFNTSKATEASCHFLRMAGGNLNVMKLVKLVYLLDRLSLDVRGIPVVGGDYLSMRNGPVTSELLDLINSGRLYGENGARWDECISDRKDHDIHLEKMPEQEDLSNAELKLMGDVWSAHGGKTQWQLVEWCHVNCGEWTPVSRGCAPIPVERIGQALGKSPEFVRRIASEAAELNQLDRIFASE